jgi:hypothetical protein
VQDAAQLAHARGELPHLAASDGRFSDFTRAAAHHAFHACPIACCHTRAQTGERVVLQPFVSPFVDKYHAWMEDEWLRGA